MDLGIRISDFSLHTHPPYARSHSSPSPGQPPFCIVNAFCSRVNTFCTPIQGEMQNTNSSDHELLRPLWKTNPGLPTPGYSRSRCAPTPGYSRLLRQPTPKNGSNRDQSRATVSNREQKLFSRPLVMPSIQCSKPALLAPSTTSGC